MPLKEAFSTVAEYYGTALHELAHASGVRHRLNRETLTTSDGFGTGEIPWYRFAYGGNGYTD